MPEINHKISVALCTFNGAKFLPAQLESMLAQTRLPDEVIVGDDRSTDDTVPIIREFSGRAPFPVHIYVNETNLGSTQNFAAAIGRCAGGLIFLCDQDDIWRPEKIAVTAREFDREDVTMVFSDADLIGEDGARLNKRLWEFTFPENARRMAERGKMFEALLDQNAVTGAATAFRASLREHFLPVPPVPNMLHDAWIALFAAALGKISALDQPLIEYRQHTGQQIGINWQFQRQGRRAQYEWAIEFLRDELARLEKLAEIAPRYSQLEAAAPPGGLSKLIAAIRYEKEQRAGHLAARKDLPRNPLKRIVPILQELAAGRYHKFSRGFLSAAKDMRES